MGTYSCLFDDGLRFNISTTEVDQFRDSCLGALPALIPFKDRIGRCFWFDLLVLTERYSIDLRCVLQPLLDLELGEPTYGIKPAAPFTRLPLRGLWHKHWFSPRFMPSNILAVTQRENSMDWIWDIAKEGDI
jgi:hypothetical protein